MLYEEITSLIGSVPSGSESVIYIVCMLFLLYLLDCFYGAIRLLANHFMR